MQGLTEQIKKEHKLFLFYPSCYFLMNKFPKRWMIKVSQRRKKALKELYVNEDVEYMYLLYWCRKWSAVFILFLCVNVLTIAISVSERKQEDTIINQQIERLSYGEGDQSVETIAKIRKVQDKSELVNQRLTLSIGEQKYTETEFLKLAEEIKAYIDSQLLGENRSYEEIRNPLSLVTSYQNTPITISWDLGSSELIKNNGTLQNEEIKQEGETIVITAIIKYEKYRVEYEIPLRIMPKIISEEEKILKKLKEELEQREKETQTEKKFILPNQIEDYNITFQEQRKDSSSTIFLIGIGCVLLAAIGMEKEMQQKQKQRELQLLMDYPEIVNQFTLLIGAGMTTKMAFGRITTEYAKKIEKHMIKKRYAYEEMVVTWNEMKNGVSEGIALEQFGKRIRLMPYLKFSTLLVQNLRKGSKNLIISLELEAINALEERKELAKRLGEEAGTKLLMPMAIMLLIVLLLIMIPAFLSF